MKLTLINIMWQGTRYSAFVNLLVWEDGKVYITMEDMQKLCNVNIPRGHCIGICV